MKEVTIKPCPFCGDDDPKVLQRWITFVWKPVYAVECMNGKCQATGPVRKSYKRAVNAWNRRR